MQIQITPTPSENTILFCSVDCYENVKTKNAQGKTKTVQVKTASLNMVMGDEEAVLQRIHSKFPKINPVLIKCKILKEWTK